MDPYRGKRDPVRVTAAFLPPDSKLLIDSWMNRAAARLAAWNKVTPMVHCELLFPDANVAYSITANGGSVHKISSKGFTRDWEFISLTVPPAAASEMFRVCEDAHKRKAGFNWAGYYASNLVPISGGGSSYFCSELCATAIQAGGLLKDGGSPASYVPGRLYDELQKLTQAHKTAHPVKMADGGAGLAIKW